MTKYSVGYVVAEARFDNVVEVLWDAGHDSDFGRTREALEPLAATLAGAGWRVQRAEGAIPFDDGDIRWPVLIVTAPEDVALQLHHLHQSSARLAHPES